MTQEEKKYEAALQTARQWINDGCTDKEKICLECVFPELRESEDERIRKALIDVVRQLEDLYEGLANTYNFDESLLAELPKVASRAYAQGDIEELRELKKKIEASMEQKPAEWSEEDEKIIRTLILEISIYDFFGGIESERIINFLKSLRPQWKPTEEKEPEYYSTF